MIANCAIRTAKFAKVPHKINANIAEKITSF
jgi:hypothetical protein